MIVIVIMVVIMIMIMVMVRIMIMIMVMIMKMIMYANYHLKYMQEGLKNSPWRTRVHTSLKVGSNLFKKKGKKD